MASNVLLEMERRAIGADGETIIQTMNVSCVLAIPRQREKVVHSASWLLEPTLKAVDH